MSVRLSSTDLFADRHIGPSDSEVQEMLAVLGLDSLESLIDQTLPPSIRMSGDLQLPEALTERQLLARATDLANKNTIFRSYIGMGYSGTITPPAVQRGILENPSWYTQYTPYQAEIAQGRLEALLNYQTMVIDLTGMEIANASLLDEGTAAAEAMMMLQRQMKRSVRARFFVSAECHPQTISVIKTRAVPLGIEVVIGDHRTVSFDDTFFGALVQYPASDGAVYDYSDFCETVHKEGAFVIVAADLMSLALLASPASFGADVAVGSTQRFGVPIGFGGPHAAYFATGTKFKRQIPGRIIGVSEDAQGKPALRMALQTREQHIRRDKATSNICTAQVLLAVIAGMYAVYHGPSGIRDIATRIHNATRLLAAALADLGLKVHHDDVFDTLRVSSENMEAILKHAEQTKINLRSFEDGSVGIALDETVFESDLADLLEVFGCVDGAARVAALSASMDSGYAGECPRKEAFMTHPVFSDHHSEAALTRYMHKLAKKDLSLTTSMIALGSCTMKLNAVAELMPITMPAFNQLHPFAPANQAEGYHEMMAELRNWLNEITGFSATSLQPNSGASGEYAGLLLIRAYHESRGEGERNICIIPSSAHGTNPASAVMAGMKVVVVACDDQGNIDVDDLNAKAAEAGDLLSALMITYPSTHGVFEETVKDICATIHSYGGQVYMDGANMNAQVGLCRPGDIGADVCHLNLHKTFAIPHGGGGPGVGPICAASHLAPFMPGHPVVEAGGSTGPVAAAPFGSASILLISWAYIAMLGMEGLKKSTQIAILNANYMAHQLREHYDVLYTGANGRVAHEYILDLRNLRQNTVLTEVDVAKRLMDYGFHAPTMSWPVVGTVMVEPTESENKAELDRFVDAMISIRAEIQEVELGLIEAKESALANAPHTADAVMADEWNQAYSREKAAFPISWSRENKFWPSVRRINDAHGDRNLVCSCLPLAAFEE
ncbi:MAG: aminomethyl-transferring glycine dehydrogenase [Bacteroidetes Order II. Incertae sedis bacterium]|jgi:glycine dehydrogenase|nr:aminomethyl-transferring glycine dehydrogenase [Bacteroidetes Order II. bacterium]MBT4601637.1 aminomethyl-transferring glycine dehydrogenase [Bacteroidetes Order II. bacterium]MBT5249967.1 aminomethyl-transferring glycine dehydrogenase [Bacteroidetes Order II. bacterium]MBT6200619.1 aminomethyl-transferring glycine dehydrogenase [Bacteroidetes Order II. bacterium]MBT6425102.1 aminomethyl-transferring glycine dehydrogenase [Bacteroidetes Order II. bacterium]